MTINENTTQDIGITGVRIQPLAIFPTPDGAVLHMLRPGAALFSDFGEGFGEIYFSEVLSGHVKAWKRHAHQTQHFAVPVGKIKIVLFDDREHSTTRGVLRELLLGRPDHYDLLRIPVNVWYGFTAIGDTSALICNCADIPHDPKEGITLPANDPSIPYRW
ncbi:MAG: dTDP-4-dehydrorhamnose 3,5-epimerase family protein [Desulfovibrio sp.]|nr:dTDP-4-dehydrorhamnose 3,5-epimerase family protein [Desulfovibrio sp.]